MQTRQQKEGRILATFKLEYNKHGDVIGLTWKEEVYYIGDYAYLRADNNQDKKWIGQLKDINVNNIIDPYDCEILIRWMYRGM